jgi:phasin family protein
MFTIPKELTDVVKANFETNLAVLSALTAKSFEGVEKVVDLNINAGKASLEDSAIAARQLMTAKDPQEFLTLTAAQAQPTAAKAIAYGRHFVGIVTSVQAEITRTMEEQITESGRMFSSAFDDLSKNAPAGSENVLALFKSAITNTQDGYQQFNAASKQAGEVMEANLNSAVSQFSQAAGKTRARK